MFTLINLILLISVLVILLFLFRKNNKEGFSGVDLNESFTIIPQEQIIEIDDLEVKPNLIVIMPNTVITWKNTSKESIKLFINTENEQKIIILDPNEDWSYAYKVIRQYDYIGVRLFNQNPSTIGKVNNSINGRIIVTGI